MLSGLEFTATRARVCIQQVLFAEPVTAGWRPGSGHCASACRD
jgi:hypothetical protein